MTERLIQDAQTAFLCVVDAEMLISIHGCSVAEARTVLGDDSSSHMSVDELNAFLALVYVREVKGGRNMELSSFWLPGMYDGICRAINTQTEMFRELNRRLDVILTQDRR
ncbi:hypothetical protein CRENBAI_019901 [Crenichthys baileyi]|uniref:Uncharacterized protein n=1 Tax=Crenichthys baileyi TaxID=28760 RepID=A0AAV9ST43_9TELE